MTIAFFEFALVRNDWAQIMGDGILSFWAQDDILFVGTDGVPIEGTNAIRSF